MKTTRTAILFLSALLTLSACGGGGQSGASKKEIVVHPEQRYLAYQDGSPFFWLADTQWDIVHKGTRALVDEVLDDRQSKGFTAIQVPMMFHWSTVDPNRYGELPGEPGDWNEAYWQHVDYVVDGVIARGMHPIILPAWGNLSGGEDNFFTQEQAYDYGVWLAQRYASRGGIVYVVGGDRRERQDCCGIVDAIARGIKSVDADRLVSFHSHYQSRDESHGNAAWLDFSAWQTGQLNCDNNAEFLRINDYLSTEWGALPTRPVVNMEPRYENLRCNGAPFSTEDVRLSAYWSVFAGSVGISYGQDPLWYFTKWEYNDGIDRSDEVREALAAGFSSQIQHLKNLMLSRPFFSRLPDNDLVGGASGISATRGDGYIMVYSGFGEGFSVDTSSLEGKQLNVWWFNPRDGTTQALEPVTGGGALFFEPDGAGLGNDWVLVLDDASRGFSMPGQ